MPTPTGATILGIGNVLLGDDAIGPYVIALLAARYQMPEGTTLLDAGTPGIDLADYLAGRPLVVLVDSIREDAPPGTVRVHTKADLLGHRASGLRQGGHDPSMRDALVSLEMAGLAPEEVIFVGVVPEHTRTGAPLSAAGRGGVERATQEVVAQLAALGIELRERTDLATPDIWWEPRRDSFPLGPPATPCV